MNLYTLISKHGTIRRVIYHGTFEVPAEQADIDRREYQLADTTGERLAADARQQAKDAKEMTRLFARGIEKVEDVQ